MTDISPKDANRNLLPPTGRNRGRPSTFGGRLPAAKTRRVMGTQHRKLQTGNSNSGFQRNSANNMNQLNHSKARYEKPTNRNLVLNGAHVKKTNATLQQPLKGNESNGKKQDMIRHARPSLPANGSKQNQSLVEEPAAKEIMIVVVKSCVLVYRTRSCFEALVPTLPFIRRFCSCVLFKNVCRI